MVRWGKWLLRSLAAGLALLLLAAAVFAQPEQTETGTDLPADQSETGQVPEEEAPPEETVPEPTLPPPAQIPPSEVLALDMAAKCTVDRDGSCLIELTAILDFTESVSDFVIPISRQARDVHLTGADYKLSTNQKYTLLTLTGSHRGNVELHISYRLAETVTPGEESQLFRVTLLYPGWVCPIKAFRFTLQMPGAFEAYPTILSGYYGDLIDNYMAVTVDEGTVYAELSSRQYLADHESMTVEMELPVGYFDLRFLAGKTARVDRLLFFLLLVLAVVYWFFLLRGKLIVPRRQAMPPLGRNAGEIPYLLTAQKGDLALMIVHWASLGYLTIHRTRRGGVYLTRQIDMGSERQHYELSVYRTLFKRSDHCDVRSAEYLRARELAVDRTQAEWKPRIFAARSGSALILRLLAAAAGLCVCLACLDNAVAPRSWRWFLIVPMTLLGGLCCYWVQLSGGSLLRRHSLRTVALCAVGLLYLFILGRKGGMGKLMFLCLLLQIAVGWAVRCGGRRTKEGTDLAAELLGFRRYLLSSSSRTLRNNLKTDPQYFYQVLPYADALQVGRIFAGAFESTRLESCDWLDWEGRPLKTAPGFYRRYQLLMAKLRGERPPVRIRLPRARAGRPAGR